MILASCPGVLNGIARYQLSAGVSAPEATRCSMSRTRRPGSCPAASRSVTRGAEAGSMRRSNSSGSHGTWKAYMYQDIRNWRLVTSDRMKAAGCGTESAVNVATRSGRAPASVQATAAPQSCPTTCTVRPAGQATPMSATTSSTSWDIR